MIFLINWKKTQRKRLQNVARNLEILNIGYHIFEK